MKSSVLQKIGKFSLVLGVLWMLLFGFSQFGMNMDMSGGSTAKCPFSGHSMSICNMNPLEHIQELQSMFTTLPSKSDTLLLLSILLASLILGKLSLLKRFFVPKIQHLKTKISFENNFHIPNPLKSIFSEGIIGSRAP
jgi:hypothetical protein